MCKNYFKTDLTITQAEIVKTIAFRLTKKLVISCLTRYGKSWCVAQAVLLYAKLNPNKRILLVAPTLDQTKIIRNYISTFILENKEMSCMVDVAMSGLDRLKNEVSKKRITLNNGTEITILSAEGTGDRLMGFGGDLIIDDEECLINYEVYQQKISRMTGDSPDAMRVSIGNPWNRNNQMWDFWNDPSYTKIQVGWKTALKEGRITEEFLADQRRLLNPITFKVLYDAEFPENAEDSLFDYNCIAEANEREFKFSKGRPLNLLGVDVARFGLDSTVLTHIQTFDGKYQLVKQYVFNKMNTMQTVGKVRDLHSNIGFDSINVDVCGLGAGVVDRLKEEGLSVVEAHFGQAPTKSFEESSIVGSTKARYEDQTRNIVHSNKKAEQYFRLARLFEEGKISIKGCDTTLIDNLRKMGYEITSGGKTKIIDPEDGKSPDYGDSLVYACWEDEGEVVIDW